MTLLTINEVSPDPLFHWAIAINIGIAIGLYIFFKRSKLFLDDTTENNLKNRSWSLAKFQLAWWTFIIFSAFLWVLRAKGWHLESKENIFSESSLILLSISIGTMATGKIIDVADKKNSNQRFQDTTKANGPFGGLINDANGVSISRFQQLLFTIIFGLIFLIQSGYDSEMFEMSGEWLGLMGISSAGYSMIKINENAPSKNAPKENPSPPSDSTPG